MTASRLKLRVKREMSAEKPTVWIGKDGIMPRITNEIANQLDKKETVKIKVLKSALENEEAKNIAINIAQETGAKLIDVLGHTFVLYKPKKKEKI